MGQTIQPAAGPSQRFSAVTQRVADRIVGDRFTVVGSEEVFPLGIAVGIGAGLTVDRFARQVAAVVIAERSGVAAVAGRDGGQLVQGVIGIGVGNTVLHHGGNVASFTVRVTVGG